MSMDICRRLMILGPALGKEQMRSIGVEAAAEIERLRSICETIATGLRGQHASRVDMAKLAESGLHAYQQNGGKE